MFLLLCLVLMPRGAAPASGSAQLALPDFASSDRTASVAFDLREFLLELHYSQAMQRLYGIDYKVLTLYEDPPLEKPESLLGLASGLTPRQVAALRFFHLGEALTEDEANELFRADDAGLRKGLERLNLVVEVAPPTLGTE